MLYSKKNKSQSIKTKKHIFSAHPDNQEEPYILPSIFLLYLKQCLTDIISKPPRYNKHTNMMFRPLKVIENDFINSFLRSVYFYIGSNIKSCILTKCSLALGSVMMNDVKN